MMNDFKTYSAEAFFDNTSYRGTEFSKDGSKILLSCDETGVYQLYRLDIASGTKVKLTDSKDTVHPVRYFPEDDRCLYMSDSGGDERFHVYVLSADGAVTDLTPGEKVRAIFSRFSADGRSFYVQSNERDERAMDLYRYDVESYERELVFQNDTGFSTGNVSPDGRYVALTQNNSNTDSDVYLVDLESTDKVPAKVTSFDFAAQNHPLSFSTDSKTLYVGTNATGEFTSALAIDLETLEATPYLEEKWDIVFLNFSSSGKYRAHCINEDASMRLVVTDMESGESISPPSIPEGQIWSYSFSADETKLSFYLDTDTSPTDLYVWDIVSGDVKRLTHSLSSQMTQEHLVGATVERFESFDGLTVPGILYKPKQASADKPVPAVIEIHGGPGGQSVTGYNPVRQFLVNNGYAVFAVNNRGSSGYGKTFFHLSDRKHGEVDLDDIVWGKKYLQSLDWVQSENVAVMGGSYGGYLTAAALTFRPEEFKLGINIFGVTNWVRTLDPASIPPWWESFKKALYDMMGDPATDTERHRRISPLFHAHNITKPLMVVQGVNDPRVLKIESDELVEAARKNNIPVEYVVFDDEGHGFTKKANRITAANAFLSFLQEHMPA
ncbi:S9 family peptidase [Veronia nyctiphanis]|uniref:S9 family peptidase n=1 Tax=Veronia nyctiphanis TaxID=1278244 RepID=A0A4Q0YMA1_9GAMM|nr:S9 family peptidase [Veronia nyctiphanis]RXJ71505.1 S9 family peptidase [Veronia nyctiphanis]